MTRTLDAVVVGAGPNGLAAAAVLAQSGRSVQVIEATDRPGGGSRSAQLTRPGFVHDICSAVHPFGAVSPAFEALGLDAYGLRWRHPEVLVAHPLDDGTAGALLRDLDATVAGLGEDGDRYRRLVGPVVKRWPALASTILGPVVQLPRHPLAVARLGLRALPPATLTLGRFSTDAARGLLAGSAAHSLLPLDRPLTTGVAVALHAAGHVAGWPVAEGGSQAITDALVATINDHGGSVECGRPVRRFADLPAARAVLFDLSPGQVEAICGDRFADRYRRRLRRFRHGPGAYKIDYALSGPMPWTAEACRRAGTVHLGGTLAEIADAEATVAQNRYPERPFVLVAQQTLADPGRAPAGHHTLWAYTHVPPGSSRDMRPAIEAQFERFAPGWRSLVLESKVTTAVDFEAYNENYVGGDIAGGAMDRLQLLGRPFLSSAVHPYRTPEARLFLCSSSTPPGGGVHGMCGWNAAHDVLRTVLR